MEDETRRRLAALEHAVDRLEPTMFVLQRLLTVLAARHAMTSGDPDRYLISMFETLRSAILAGSGRSPEGAEFLERAVDICDQIETDAHSQS